MALSHNQTFTGADGKTYTVKDGSVEGHPSFAGGRTAAGMLFLVDENNNLVKSSSTLSSIGSRPMEKYIEGVVGASTTTKADGSLTDAEQIRKYGYTQSPADVGNAQRVQMQMPQMGTYENIQATGQYVIADMVRDGKVIAQRIYDPNGRFVQGVSPDKNAQAALTQLQQIRHGNQQQRVEGLQSKLNDELSFINSTTRASQNPTKVNSHIANTAAQLVAAKTGVSDEFVRNISYGGTVLTGPNNDLRNWQAIVNSQNSLGSLIAANRAINSNPNFQSLLYPKYGQSEFAGFAEGSITTANGFNIIYEKDMDVGEAIAGRLRVVTPSGYQVADYSEDPLMNRLLDFQFGLGGIDPNEFTQFVTGKSFRKDNNDSYINSLTNAVNTYNGSQNPFANVQDTGYTISLDWAPGGSSDAAWQRANEEYAQQQEAERTRERGVQTPTTPVSPVTPVAPTAPAVPSASSPFQPTGPITQPPTGTQPATGINPITGITQQPSSYTGTGFLPLYTTGQQPQPTQIPYSQTAYGTLPFMYTPTTPYTVGAGGISGTTPTPTPQQTEIRTYRNNAGLTASVTFVNGQPTTTIPSGFFPASSEQAAAAVPAPPVPVPPQPPTVVPPQMAMGGFMPSTQNIVKGFKPDAMQRIASSLGYTGDINNFNNFLASNPSASQKYNSYMQAAQQMANGGYVRKYQEGGDVQEDPRVLQQQYIPQQDFPAGATLPQVQADIAKTPGLPMGATVVPVGTVVEAGQLVSPMSGQVSGQFTLPTAQAATTAAAMPQPIDAVRASVVESTAAVSDTVDALQAAQGTLDPRAQVMVAQQTASSVGNVQAAQGNAILMTNPVQRQIQDGELIAPAANAETAAKFAEQIEAAEATPTKQATVQGQLEQLMTQFEGGNTPAWAAASMRNAMATLSARGLGASSLAGQAVIQAAMEAALPIAQIDAQVQASFESQNLSNRQQRAMLAAQQRAAFIGQEFDQAFQSRVANAAKISDVANMNFTAEQQVALENSRIANTMELQNLSNRQAVVLAEAAALANMDMANLNNRQQAAVMNAQNFLAVDMQNLSNQQQTDLFKAQSRIQALFTDQAAQNAAQQFNASSENQVNQFFSSLATQVGQFNATQANAQAQFNAGQINTIERFNAEINNQRDQFNAQNRLIIDQSNAQWRREISTAATAAVNRANEINAAALVGLSQSAYNNLWQYYRDNMEWAWTSAENERQRVMNLAITQLQADASKDIQSMKDDYASSSAFGSLIGKMLTSDLSGSILGNLFG